MITETKMINFKKLILTLLFITTVGNTSIKCFNKELAKKIAITSLKTAITGVAVYSAYEWIQLLESNCDSKALTPTFVAISTGLTYFAKNYLIKLQKANPELFWTLMAGVGGSFITYKESINLYQALKNKNLPNKTSINYKAEYDYYLQNPTARPTMTTIIERGLILRHIDDILQNPQNYPPVLAAYTRTNEARLRMATYPGE